MPNLKEGNPELAPLLRYEIDADIRLWFVSGRKRASFQFQATSTTVR